MDPEASSFYGGMIPQCGFFSSETARASRQDKGYRPSLLQLDCFNC